MKSLFTFAVGLLCLLSLGAHAQTITNLDFETWATRNGIEAPANWQTSDDVVHNLILQQLGLNTYINTGTVTKTSPAHGGAYAASLTTRAVTGLTGLLSGILVLGTKLGPSTIGGVPYTTRPAQLQFYYRYSGPTTDSAAAVVALTATVGGQPQIVGTGNVFLAPTTGSSFVQLSVPIAYQSSVTPDSVRVLFSSGAADAITSGSTLVIDDVALTGSALAIRADAGVQNLLTVSPNPSTGGRFTISSPDKPELAAAPLEVLDALGRSVARQAAQAAPSGPRELDLSGLSTGIYLLRLDSRQGTIVRQLTVK
jgi:hypothetical protein